MWAQTDNNFVVFLGFLSHLHFLFFFSSGLLKAWWQARWKPVFWIHQLQIIRKFLTSIKELLVTLHLLSNKLYMQSFFCPYEINNLLKEGSSNCKISMSFIRENVAFLSVFLPCPFSIVWLYPLCHVNCRLLQLRHLQPALPKQSSGFDLEWILLYITVLRILYLVSIIQILWKLNTSIPALKFINTFSSFIM